ncbi:MAG: RAMP superfamily CRISPR-associated protein [Candidatus Bipolaricaulia bacterium]
MQDEWTRLSLLAQALITDYKEQARMGTRREAGGFKYWLEEQAMPFLQAQNQLLTTLHLTPTLPDLFTLPFASWGLQFTFTLYKPYLSRDEQDFYIIDNPVRKDKVFKLPYVAPSSWKGSLRSALRMVRGIEDEKQERDDCAMIRLFGPVKDEKQERKGEQEEERFRQGHLHFFPTFFDRISLEVINPHPRDTGAGKQPIYIESVPGSSLVNGKQEPGAQGTFTLLYVPFDRIGRDVSGTQVQVAEDLELVTQGLKAMLTQYGFGAKTSSGFGVAEDQLVGSGELRLAVEGLSLNEETTTEGETLHKPEIPEEVKQFRADHQDEDFTLKPNKWREQHQASRKEQDRYKEARAAYWEYQQQLEAYEAQLKEQETEQIETEDADRDIFKATFTSLEELIELAKRVAQALKGRANT